MIEQFSGCHIASPCKWFHVQISVVFVMDKGFLRILPFPCYLSNIPHYLIFSALLHFICLSYIITEKKCIIQRPKYLDGCKSMYLSFSSLVNIPSETMGHRRSQKYCPMSTRNILVISLCGILIYLTKNFHSTLLIKLCIKASVRKLHKFFLSFFLVLSTPKFIKQ